METNKDDSVGDAILDFIEALKQYQKALEEENKKRLTAEKFITILTRI